MVLRRNSPSATRIETTLKGRSEKIEIMETTLKDRSQHRYDARYAQLNLMLRIQSDPCNKVGHIRSEGLAGSKLARAQQGRRVPLPARDRRFCITKNLILNLILLPQSHKGTSVCGVETSAAQHRQGNTRPTQDHKGYPC